MIKPVFALAIGICLIAGCYTPIAFVRQDGTKGNPADLEACKAQARGDSNRNSRRDQIRACMKSKGYREEELQVD